MEGPMAEVHVWPFVAHLVFCVQHFCYPVFHAQPVVATLYFVYLTDCFSSTKIFVRECLFFIFIRLMSCIIVFFSEQSRLNVNKHLHLIVALGVVNDQGHIQKAAILHFHPG